MSLRKTPLMLAGLLALSVSYAQNTGMSRDQKQAEEDRIEQTAKADKEACKSMSGNAKDVCEAEAKAKEKVAKAELDARFSGSERDRAKVADIKAEAEYEVAKERCEDQEGDAQRNCKQQAKERERAARGEAGKAPKY
ncbi:MAG: hypothetical protein AB1430_14550 [Pseudomonadota bacterium]